MSWPDGRNKTLMVVVGEFNGNRDGSLVEPSLL